MFASFHDDDTVCTFMTDRQGGVSANSYGSMNLGLYSGDDSCYVYSNRRILCNELNIDDSQLFIPKEVHGDSVVWVDRQTLESDLVCDALVTTEKGLCLGVTTADCVPVLLYDEERSVCAAVHAGWKGVVAQILPKTITEIRGVLGVEASNLYIRILPCISLPHFEVGEEVVEQFARVFSVPEMEHIVARKGFEKPHIDLRRAVALQSLSCGVPSHRLDVSDVCTFQTESLFSARRDGFASGRMLSGVILRG